MVKMGFRRFAVLALLAGIILIALVQIGISYRDVGFTGESGSTLVSYDLSSVPQSVADDASRVARDLFGTGDKYREFMSQLLSSYVESRDKDFILLFNPGGWGTTSMDDAPGWESIVDGITTELSSAGYRSVVLEYQRTSKSLVGRWTELVEILSRYPSKSRGLAQRIEFLTNNIPGVTVIVTGESNGTVISDYAMARLRENRRVYSIQTGNPFWHQPVVRERTLILNSNGVRPDALSRGEIPTVIFNTIKQWLRLAATEDRAHNALYFDAPGHDYSWQYPEVYYRITGFLRENFSDSGTGARQGGFNRVR